MQVRRENASTEVFILINGSPALPKTQKLLISPQIQTPHNNCDQRYDQYDGRHVTIGLRWKGRDLIAGSAISVIHDAARIFVYLKMSSNNEKLYIPYLHYLLAAL
jgi:hypothetical protein